MASASALPLAERADVHKSCKSLETLLGVMNDYCEAAGAVVMLQKKLSKALKETAALKVTGEIPANAMNTSASIFEALSDINAKFTKIVDKEYDGISAEVRKWFKKLNKEEKNHDERIANSNLRIKQAGQLYEKKSKKNPRDAIEEHGRYINLISTLGPEVSQEKYNHAFQVTQRHTITTYSVAASFSRMADAEWLRTCEAVRRFATPVGQLGEWRTLCEGGWTGAIPQDLPNLASPQQSSVDETSHSNDKEEDRANLPAKAVNSRARGEADQDRSEERSGTTQNSSGQRGWEYSSTVGTTSGQQRFRPNQSSAASSSDKSQNYPPSPTDRPQNAIYDCERDGLSQDSHPTLASFPAPPTHLPLPPSSPSQPQPLRPQASRASSVSPQLSPLTESPVEISKPAVEHNRSPVSSMSSEQRNQPSNEPPPAEPSNYGTGGAEKSSPEFGSQKISGPYRRGDYFLDEREFGVGVDRSERYGQTQPRSLDTRERLQSVERTDTGGSNGSIVAAMRRRYSQQSGVISPAPKDVPRLPLSVPDLASRYQPLDGPSSPHQRALSPPDIRQIHSPPSSTQVREEPLFPARNERGSPPGAYNPAARPVESHPSPPNREDYDPHRQRRQRADEQAEKELKARELELQAREREIEMRVRELDVERARLTNERGDVYGGDSSDSQSTNTRPIASAQQQQQQQHYSRIEFPTSPPQPRHSYSATHLVPPPGSRAQAQTRSQSPSSPSNPRQRYHSLSQPQPQSRTQELSQRGRQPEPDHAPYCGCNQCSASKYKERSATPSPQDLRPPEPPINLRPGPEKPKSWMRRLSMPVGMSNAFSLDSKKNSGTVRNVLEDGRIDRRNYEPSGVGNRSLTNLGRR